MMYHNKKFNEIENKSEVVAFRQLYIPDWLIRFKCSKNACLVYACLIYHRNRTTGRCDPGIHKLAEETGLSRKAAQRAVSELRELGLITTQERFRNSNAYSFPIHPAMGYGLGEGGAGAILPLDAEPDATGIPLWLARRKDLNFHEKLLYGFLRRYLWKVEAGLISRKEIAEGIGCTERHVKRLRQKLEETGLIETQNRGQHFPGCYVLWDHIWMHEVPEDLLQNQPEIPKFPKKPEGTFLTSEGTFLTPEGTFLGSKDDIKMIRRRKDPNPNSDEFGDCVFSVDFPGKEEESGNPESGETVAIPEGALAPQKKGPPPPPPGARKIGKNQRKHKAARCLLNPEYQKQIELLFPGTNPSPRDRALWIRKFDNGDIREGDHRCFVLFRQGLHQHPLYGTMGHLVPGSFTEFVDRYLEVREECVRSQCETLDGIDGTKAARWTLADLVPRFTEQPFTGDWSRLNGFSTMEALVALPFLEQADPSYARRLIEVYGPRLLRLMSTQPYSVDRIDEKLGVDLRAMVGVTREDLEDLEHYHTNTFSKLADTDNMNDFAFMLEIDLLLVRASELQIPHQDASDRPERLTT